MKSSSILTKAVVPKRAQEEIMMTRQVPNDARVRVLALILRRRPSEVTDTTVDLLENPRGMGRESGKQSGGKHSHDSGSKKPKTNSSKT